VFFVSGLLASIFASFFYEAALGASGAIMGILGCLAILRPRMTIWLYWIPMPMFIAAVVWALIDLFGMLFIPSNVANAAHIAGLISGIVFGLLWRGKYKLIQEKKKTEKFLSEEEIEKWENEWMKKSK